MIKLNGLNKYFNRKKSNEIHVINDISLTLPDKGLVVLLGPSGSGKTTLLNVLGGLDKVQAGSITFDDETIDKYNASKWDQIRNKKVGYIFQNYNLLTNLTVYDNISLTLNMVGIYNKEEIDKRIDYILDNMGMINYRKRRASQLSGGQQQRVAIARALAKNPQVIIADEPTGNLDSKNTQDIMNIIKKISQNKLVVLVTHEENIANFYGDRIIRLKDGQIVSDISNKSNGSLDVQHETDIYLGDMRTISDTKDDNSSLKVYTDENVDDNLEIKLIVKNKTIYIDVNSQEYKKMQLLEKDSEIRVFEGKYEKQSSADFMESDFNLQEVITEQKDMERRSVITIKDSLKIAVNRLKGASKFGKLFYVGFFGVSILIAIAIGMLSGILTMKPDDFLNGSDDIVIFDKDVNDYDDIMALAEHESVNYVQLNETFTFNVQLPTIYQSMDSNKSESRSVVYSQYLDTSKIIKGRAPVAPNEFVIEKALLDQILKGYDYRYLGVNTVNDFFNLKFTIKIDGINGYYDYEMIPVGVVDDIGKVFYVDEKVVLMQQLGVPVYELFADDITMERGFAIADSDEQLFYDVDSMEEPLPLNKIEHFDKEFRVVGTYTVADAENAPRQLVKYEDLREAYFTYTFKSVNQVIYFHSNDVDDTVKYLKDQGFDTAESTYQTQYTYYRQERLTNGVGIIIFASVVIGASAISYFFILRSSLLSRIYEVSVYRALGITKNNIRKMFLIEVLLITTLTSLIGYLGTSFVMYRIQVLSADYMSFIYISPLSILAGLVIIYGVNILFGLLPVSNLLRKTPAEILSKYDF